VIPVILRLERTLINVVNVLKTASNALYLKVPSLVQLANNFTLYTEVQTNYVPLVQLTAMLAQPQQQTKYHAQLAGKDIL